MLKSKHFSLLALFLTVAILLSGNPAANAASGKLSDIDGHWARQEITEMYCSDIISGYPGGVFLPNNSVTKLEAVALLIRIQGLKEQALDMENAKVDYAVPTVNWGKGYLLMGVELGMLNKDYLMQLGPGEPASRAEVAVLVYHALKLKDAEDSLNFADADQIPDAYRSCVAAVVESGLMQGLPGNVFGPNDEINRGQMAVLVSRILELNYGGTDVRANRYSGTITEILSMGQESWRITVNSNTSKLADSSCEVFLDGTPSTVAVLRVDDRVKLVFDEDDQIVFISVTRKGGASGSGNGTTTPGVSTSSKGKVESLLQVGDAYWLRITDLDGNEFTRAVTEGIRVDEDGSRKELSSLSRGDYIEVKISGDKITEINTLSTKTVKGVVTSVRTSKLTVRRDDNGSDADFAVPSNVVVVKSNQTSDYDAVKKDDRVEVIMLDDSALRINIISSPNVEGVIREVSTSGTNIITLRDDDGYTQDYVVDTDVEIVQDGSRINFKNLQEDDRVKLELNSKNRIIYIEVIDAESDKLTGEIRSLKTSGSTLSITIRNDDGDSLYYVVDSDVEVRRDNSYLAFNKLSVGDRVKVEINSRDRVYYIEAVDDDSTTVKGIISDLSLGSSPFLFITKSSGNSKSTRYYIADNITVKRDGETLKLRDLVIGSEVTVTLSYGEAKKIEVTDDENITVPGTVVSVKVSNRKITIEQINGSEFTYDIATGAVLKNSKNRTISLSDVEEDWEVELELEDGRVSLLTEVD